MKKLNIKQLGHDLRVKRAENDVSQRKVASQIGTTLTTIGNIENGKRTSFNFNTILGVVTYLDKTINDYVI